MSKYFNVINQAGKKLNTVQQAPPYPRGICFRIFLCDPYWYWAKVFDDTLSDKWAFKFEYCLLVADI